MTALTLTILPKTLPSMVLGLPELRSPHHLWALLAVPALLAFYLVALHTSASSPVRTPNAGMVAAVMRGQPQWKRHFSVAMSLLALAAAVVAWSRPLGIEKVPRERATIVVAIDASRSMGAKDVDPTRMDAAKQAATRFIDTMPEGFNVSVVRVSGSPTVLVPPSKDRAVVRRAIDNIEPSDGTALGDTIIESMDSIKQAPRSEDGTPAPAAIVLLSDGGNNHGPDPVPLATKAGRAKVPIHTIAFGTQTGYVDLDGRRERVAPDTQVMKQIASSSRGQSWEADSAPRLDKVYQDVHSSVGYEDVKKEVTATWAFYAMGFAVLAGVGVLTMAVRR